MAERSICRVRTLERNPRLISDLSPFAFEAAFTTPAIRLLLRDVDLWNKEPALRIGTEQRRMAVCLCGLRAGVEFLQGQRTA